MKIEFELEDKDIPRVKMFVDHMIEFELNFSTEPDTSLLYFLNSVSRLISQEALK